MTGEEFEYFLDQLFEKKGYFVRRTSKTGDQGVDLILEKNGEKIAVQAKRYSDKVGNKAVQEVTSGIAHYKCNIGWVITNNYFTKSAIELAHSNNIELIDRERLQNLIYNG